jgi:hypothetical protein
MRLMSHATLAAEAQREGQQPDRRDNRIEGVHGTWIERQKCRERHGVRRFEPGHRRERCDRGSKRPQQQDGGRNLPNGESDQPDGFGRWQPS